MFQRRTIELFTQLACRASFPCALACSLALSTGTLARAAAASEVPPAATFGEETSVVVVEVPVEVSRDGKPVAGLTEADFEVRERGRALPIVGFEQVEIGAPPAPGAGSTTVAAPSLAARRHVFLLFDLAFSRRERLREGVVAARALLAQGLDASDLVAIGAYTPNGELPLLLSFTGDRTAAGRALDAIVAAIDGRKPGVAVPGERRDPLRLTGFGVGEVLDETWPLSERDMFFDTLHSLAPLRGIAPGTSSPGAGKGKVAIGFLQATTINHAGLMQIPNLQERRRAQVRVMHEGLRRVAMALRDVEGRKYLALFSEGFPNELVDVVVPESYDDPSFGGSELLADLSKTLVELRRSGWVVHAVNLSGPKGGLFESDGLFLLANGTGGTLVESSADLAAGLGRALSASSHVYVLGVQVEGPPSDAAFHALDVRVRGAGRGTTVRRRAGYYAPQPFQQQPAVQRLADAATLIAGGEQRDELGVSVVMAPLRRDGDSTRVGVVVEVPGDALPAGAAHGGLEVFGYAMDAGGVSSDFFSYALDVDRQQLGARSQSGVRFVAALDLPARWHELRLLVRERSGGRWSLLSVPIEIAAAGAGGAELAALFLPDSSDPWLVVRDPAVEGFALHGRQLAPAVRPQVAPAGDAQLLLVGRGLTGGGAALRTRIFDADGKQVTGGSLEVLSLTPGANGEPDMALARLHTGAMPSGDYRLEVTLAEAGLARAITSGQFRVGAPG